MRTILVLKEPACGSAKANPVHYRIISRKGSFIDDRNREKEIERMGEIEREREFERDREIERQRERKRERERERLRESKKERERD